MIESIKYLLHKKTLKNAEIKHFLYFKIARRAFLAEIKILNLGKQPLRGRKVDFGGITWVEEAGIRFKYQDSVFIKVIHREAPLHGEILAIFFLNYLINNYYY